MANHTPSVNTERVTSRIRLLALLNRFKDHLSILTVTLPNSNTRYTSAILDINATENCLLLDELTPEDGHRRLLQARKCTVEVFTKGQGLRFTTKLVAEGSEKGIGYYKVTMPASMDYYLRRTNYRASLPRGERTPIWFKTQDGTLIEGDVLDLSLGGVGFRVPRSPWAEGLQQGTEIPACRIRLDSGDALYCDIKIRHTGLREDRTYVRVGARFVNLDKRVMKALERHIAALDREHLKSAARQ